jgi:hypothetical protein
MLTGVDPPKPPAGVPSFRDDEVASAEAVADAAAARSVAILRRPTTVPEPCQLPPGSA